MKLLRIFLPVILVFSLTGCIELIDDLSLNLDGSGTFKYTVNLSSSKVKINSILALDSLDGKKVPSIDDIKAKVHRFKTLLTTQEGISNVTFDTDFNNFIFKMNCDFTSVTKLQEAVKNVVLSESPNKTIPELDHNWLIFSDRKLNRSVPDITIKKSKEINPSDRTLLKEGSYTSITRFENEIDRFENKNAKVSKNKKAIMLRADPYSLTQNPHLLDNSIYLKKIEE